MQSYMIQIPSVFSYTGIVSIEHTDSTFSHAVVDRLGIWLDVSLIWSEFGTLSEPVGCSAGESSVSHSVSRLVNRRVC
jgi:hypothetical protein